MAFIIGLTGGISSGKTSVANLFQGLGVEIIDTDLIAHQLTQPGSNAIQSIRIAFGNRFILGDGSLDRAAIRDLIFSDEVARNKLETILHPLIYHETKQRLPLIQSSYGILVVPLLVETKDFFKLINHVLVVDCPESIQIYRTMQRNKLQEQEVRRIMSAQCSRSERLAVADDVIVNDADIKSLKQQVQRLHQKYLVLANKHDT